MIYESAFSVSSSDTDNLNNGYNSSSSDISGNLSTDVSCGDVFFEENIPSVDSVYSELSAVDATVLLQELHTCNYLLSALLFFTVFVWVERKIHNGVRLLFHQKGGAIDG